jgi:hypothetical protein
VNATIVSAPKATTTFDHNGWRNDQMPAHTPPPAPCLNCPPVAIRRVMITIDATAERDDAR